MSAARKIAVIDSETDPFKRDRIPEPFIWGFKDAERFLLFRETSSIIDFLRDQRIVVYAHNGGKFDYHFVLRYLPEFAEVKIISGRLVSFTIGECEFRDSMSILPIALVEYQKDEFDYAKMEKNVRAKHMPEIEAYLKSDCENLFSLVSTFRDNYGAHLTLAGSAMAQWRKIAGKVPNLGETYHAVFQPFYFGGRVEFYRRGIIEDPVEIADINSAYPFAMLHEHPYGENYETSDNPTNAEINAADFLTLTAPGNGAFAFRNDDHSTSFPNDGDLYTFNTTKWEFRAALDNGLNQNDFIVSKTFRFYEHIDFRPYVEKWFAVKNAAKESGDKANYLIAKLFLNSLYGKFGANPERYKEHIILSPDLVEASEIDEYKFGGMLGPWALMERPLAEEKRRYYNVATAASITGFVRAVLYRALRSVENPLYCDTDSITYAGKSGLTIGPEIGKWEIEGRSNYGAIVGKKLYAFKLETSEWKIATKGARLTPQEIIEIAKGGEITWKNDAPTFSPHKAPYFLARRIKQV